MRRNYDKWSIVIAGQWNRAIFAPTWLANKVFHVPEIQILYPIQGWGEPIFQAENIRIQIATNKLTLSPIKEPKDDTLQKMEDIAYFILSTLKYTPIAAFGYNFHFIDDLQVNTIPALSNLNDKVDSKFQIEEISLRRLLKLEDEVKLNLIITRVPGKQTEIAFNYHYNVKDAEEAARKIKNAFLVNRSQAEKLLRDLYNINIDDESGGNTNDQN